MHLELRGELRCGRRGRDTRSGCVWSPQFVGDDLATLDGADDLTHAGHAALAVDPTEVHDQIDGVRYQQVGDIGDQSLGGHGRIHGEASEHALG